MKILIEGADYTGKTTVAKKLKKHIDKNYKDGCIYFHNPEGLNNHSIQLYEKIKNTNDLTLKSIYLLESHHINQQTIDELSQKTNVVVDRSIFSYRCYQMIQFSEEQTLSLINEYFNLPKFDFDCAIGLTATKEELIRRAKERKGNDSLDDYFLQNIERVTEMFESFEETQIIESPRKVCYDTTSMSIDDVYNKIMEDFNL